MNLELFKVKSKNKGVCNRLFYFDGNFLLRKKKKLFDSKMMIKICIILLAGLKIGIVVVFILKLT